MFCFSITALGKVVDYVIRESYSDREARVIDPSDRNIAYFRD